MFRLEVIPDKNGRFNLCEFCPELKNVNCNATVNWNGEATYSYDKLGHIKYKFKNIPDSVYIEFIELECDRLSFKDNIRIISIDGELPRLEQGELNNMFENCNRLQRATGMLFVNNRHQFESKCVFKNCSILDPDFEVIVDLWESKDFTEFYSGCRAIDNLPYPLFSRKQCNIEILDGMFSELPYLREVRGKLLENQCNMKSAKRMFYRSGIRKMDNIFNDENYADKYIELDYLCAECKNLKHINPNFFAFIPFVVPPEVRVTMFKNVPARINL